MLIKRIEGATRNLGAPSGWDPDIHGMCSVLPIADIPDPTTGNWMVSAWEPTPEEIARIVAGGSIHLWVQGTLHPVVSMTVGGEPPVEKSPHAT